MFTVMLAAAVLGGACLIEDASFFSAKPSNAKSLKVALDEKAGDLTLTARMWVTNEVAGRLPHENARIQVTFHAADGKQLGGWPQSYAVKEGSTPWTDVKLVWHVPYGSREARFALCNWGKAGSCGITNVNVRVSRPRMLEYGNAPLPDGVTGDPWTLDDAWRTESALRTRYSLNGLWAARPLLDGEGDDFVPGPNDRWGWGKIPGQWGELAPWNNMSQVIVRSPWFGDHSLKETPIVDGAWYMRKFRMPAAAKGRRVALWFDVVNTFADVYVDGRKAGGAVFPGGAVDITPLVRPGEEQTVLVKVKASFIDWLTFDWANSDELRKELKSRRAVKQAVQACRGVTGDLYLDILPDTAKFDETYVETSVERGEISFCATVATGPGASAPELNLRATVEGCGTRKVFEGAAKRGADGVYRFVAPWADAKRWDIHTPGNLYTCRLETDGDAALPFRFGFREIRQVGHDWLLNGTPVHLRSLYNGATKTHSSFSGKAACVESCRRAKEMGFNSFIAGNYNCQAGSVSYLDGLLEACDEEGVLYAFSLPNTREFKNDLDNPVARENYRRLTREMIRRARNHPSVVFYAMNHNNTGYTQEQNPCRMDGVKPPVPSSPSHAQARAAAETAAKIAYAIDPTRIVYHHCSGLLSGVHNTECYLNWAPVQERSDWMELWSKEGKAPHYIVEYGVPLSMSWFSYRWPSHILQVPAFQSCWTAEYAASILGDRAYECEPGLEAITREEERLWAKGVPFRFGQLNGFLKDVTNDYYEVESIYTADNWRAFRGWGLTGFLPWGQGSVHARVAPSAQPFSPLTPQWSPTRWENLKGRGPVPDIVREHWEYWFDTGKRENFALTPWGKTLKARNLEDLAFIGGGDVFTEKDHHFRGGDTVRKQLVIVNDRRVDQRVAWSWSCGREKSSGAVEVGAGRVAFIPFEVIAPDAPGEHEIAAEFTFADGVNARDRFTFETYRPVSTPKIADLLLYDPKGLTRREFDRLGIGYELVTDLHRQATNGCRLVVGRECLTREIFDRDLVPNPNRWAQFQSNVLVFEQDYRTLAAIGFRAQEYGLRNVNPRYRDDDFPRYASAALRDWNGEATLTTPYYTNIREDDSRYFTEEWGPFQNTRTWRCRNRGNVASVLPEKPGAGDWRAFFDGAFNLEYAPLLEWGMMHGRMIFCQMDVTARTRPDPVADDLVRTLVARLGARTRWTREPVALGFDAYWYGFNTFVNFRADPTDYAFDQFIVSSGAEKPKDFAERIAKGGTALLLGLSAAEVRAWCPVPIACEERTNVWVNPFVVKPPPELNGVSPADFHHHGHLDFAAFTEPAEDGNEAFRIVRYGKGRLVFWQLPPWKVDAERRPYLRPDRRNANSMLGRLEANLGWKFNPRAVFYLDAPFSDDDPYRYWRW